MDCFCVLIHPRSGLKIYAKRNVLMATPEKITGYRAVTWTRKLEDAEKFGDEDSAWRWAMLNMHTEDFQVVPVAGFMFPTDGDGGSTIAMGKSA